MLAAEGDGTCASSGFICNDIMTDRIIKHPWIISRITIGKSDLAGAAW
jgi:hypothetical protein